MDTAPQRILIGDDDPVNVPVLVELLRPADALTVARDGPQTLERLQSAPLPDLILLDLMMPGADGFEVCRRIRADPALCSVPIIVVTAAACAGADAQARAACDHVQAVQVLGLGSGSSFTPELVEVFLAVAHEMPLPARQVPDDPA